MVPPDPSDPLPIRAHQSYGASRLQRLTELISEYLLNLETPRSIDSSEAFYSCEYDQEFDIKARERYQGTCEWLCLHESYRWWRSASDMSLLWLSGGSGLGKTTLLTYVVQKLQKAHNPKEIVLFSFCDAQINDEVSKVVSIFIHQLLTVLPKLKPFAAKKIDHYWSPTGENLRPRALRMPAARKWQLLCELVRNSKLHRVFLVIDALDECKNASQVDLIHYFANAASNIRVLVSSKPNEDLRSEFSKWVALRPSTFRHVNADDEDKNIRKDIDRYLVGETARLENLRGYSHDQQEAIRSHLQSYCSATFLIAKLMNKRFETAPISDLDAILSETPEDLLILYATI